MNSFAKFPLATSSGWGRIWGLGLSLLLSLAACMTIPGTDHHAFNVIPRGQEIGMGDQAYRELLQKEKISHDVKMNTILKRVGARISTVAPVKDFKWEFTLIESKEMNAFCLPGGKVAFYTGILPSLQNEAAMAIVMGHEVAHAVARHGAQRMSQGLAAQGLGAILSAGLPESGPTRDIALGAFGLGAQYGVLLPFSRSHESEADELGIHYAAQAGYDPAEGPRFWERFSKATSAGGKPPTFLSTHPSDESRIQKLRSLQPVTLAEYAKSGHYGLGESF